MNQKQYIDSAINDVIDEMWDQYDSNQDGALDQKEAVDLINDFTGGVGEGKNFNSTAFNILFNRFDSNESGSIEKEDM